MCISPQRHAIFRHLNRQKWSKHAVFCTFWLSNVLFATAAYNYSTAERPKVLRRLQFFNILTGKCAFHHRGVQFFDICTSKSGPNTSCFAGCFSPQWRAILRHLNFKKCFGADVFCTFSLQNVLFATAACNFWCLLSAPTSAPAALTGLLLDWPDTRIIDFPNISRRCIFFLLTFWLLHLLSTDLTTLLLSYASAFQLSILSEVSI